VSHSRAARPCRYRGKHLAALRDVIVVEFNYRLGALGFLALPQLFNESATTGVAAGMASR